MSRQSDPSKWVEEVGTPTLPPELQRLKSRPLHSSDQNRAFQQIAFLFLSPLAYVLAWLVIGAGSSDLLVEAPLPNGPGFLPSAVALLFFHLASKNVFVGALRWTAFVGWISIIVGSLAFAGFGISARADATVGPALRAFPVAQKVHGRSFFRSYTTLVELQDGTAVRVISRSGFSVGRSCYRAHWVAGGRAFTWLRLVDRSPAPGPGQLPWPISRSDCFSAEDLDSLGR
jgi:hypothetical protein